VFVQGKPVNSKLKFGFGQNLSASVGAHLRLAVASCLALSIYIVTAQSAQAVPAYAAQTGQPCQACHVGGLGPQLTPFGRNFKLHGYTLRTTAFNVPVSAMLQASYTSTQKPAPGPVSPSFASNENFAIDQISTFIAGNIGSHFGAFIQTTYDGVAHAFTWDNTDLRATTTLDIKGHDVVIGSSINNNPTVEDAWNTLPAWGFPYTNSTLAPAPATSPLLTGALAQTTVGVTGYAWIDSAFYIEAGGYESPGATDLIHLGADPTSPGSINGIAPYERLAYQTAINGYTLEVGAFGLQASIFPGLDRSLGLTDKYNDLGIDASLYKAFSNTDVITVNARYLNEHQFLDATCILALSTDPACADNTVTDMRADASYYWRNKIGGTIQIFDTTGSPNSIIYGANRIVKPDTTGLMFQIDGTPFGGLAQPQRRVNVRVGIQYTLYTRYNGADINFDGAGTNARDNNTFRVFTWFVF
jgi:hypothetical protein